MKQLKLSITESEEKRIKEFLQVLRTPCDVYRNNGSFFNTADFEQEFRSKLLAHDVFIGSPLFQQSFDAAFVTSCEHAGFDVRIASAGQRFWDVEIDGKRISLKSTKAKRLPKKTLHISKLTEAAWIQDCRTAKRRQQETIELFSLYTAEVDSIIQLRYFNNRSFYELVEIPVSLFKQVASVGRSHFNADGPTINIPIGKNPPDFTLKLDRSDAKISVTRINKELCAIHGTWQL